MTTRRSSRFWAPLAIVVFATTFLILTYQLPAEARSAPLLVGWFTLLLGLVDVATRFDNAFGVGLMRILNPAGLEELSSLSQPPQAFRHTLLAMGLVVLLVGALLLIGVIGASALVILVAFWVGGAGRYLSVAFAAGFTLLVWVVFALLLRLELFPGLLFGGSF